MANATKQIDDQTLANLALCEVRGAELVITERLDRKDYARVNEILEMMGGKWSRKDKAHVFPACPRALLDTVVLTGRVVDRKRLFQFFETPAALAERMVALAAIDKTCRVLEPSAGHGALAKAIVRRPYRSLTLLEVDPAKVDVYLTPFGAQYAKTLVVAADFLAYADEPAAYDRVVANPPFAGRQDAAHVLRMAEVLRPGGVLVSVMSAGLTFRREAEYAAVRALPGVVVEALPPDTFAASGTGANAVLVKWRKTA